MLFRISSLYYKNLANPRFYWLDKTCGLDGPLGEDSKVSYAVEVAFSRPDAASLLLLQLLHRDNICLKAMYKPII